MSRESLWERFKEHNQSGSAGPAGWQHPAAPEIAQIPGPVGKTPPNKKGVFTHNREVSQPWDPKKLVLAMAISIAPSHNHLTSKQKRRTTFYFVF